MNKALFIFAGANGSGKTSLYKRHKSIFGDIPFVNADEILKELTGSNNPRNSKFGQQVANQKIESYLSKGESFIFETVFSHESKVDLVKRAKSLGYTVSIYFCHLSDSSENIVRVKRRTELGGHDVPIEKIVSRIPRTLANVKSALHFVDEFYLFDNSYVDGHQLVAYRRPQSVIVINVDAPAWARSMIKTGHETKITSPSVTNMDKATNKLSKKYTKCIRCGRFLRGEIRPHYGICSVCEPNLNR